ncbi:MAG: 50S ribosomal protein L11 methyltransferase [bacterium]|jgi:ribosomal protein L11 methyltransferase|nr:50S ribosomal protein L11 methyltransferase [bacterium]
MSWRLALELEPTARDAAANLLFELGALGVEERDEGLHGWFADTAEPDALRRAVEDFLASLAESPATAPGLWRLRLEPVEDEDWLAGWKSHWRQQDIGRRLAVCPSWLEPQGADQRRVLRLDPGSAFGTGTHESTLLLLEWLDDLADERGPQGLATLTVLDAGCGTGILALAALKLGAAFALGIDHDPAAVAVARQNAHANGCRLNSHFLTSDPRQLGPEYRFDLVLANIQRSVIEEYFHDLLRVTAAGGRLWLAGLLADEEQAIRVLADEWGLPAPDLRRKGEWIAMGLIRPDHCEV